MVRGLVSLKCLLGIFLLTTNRKRNSYGNRNNIHQSTPLKLSNIVKTRTRPIYMFTDIYELPEHSGVIQRVFTEGLVHHSQTDFCNISFLKIELLTVFLVLGCDEKRY